MNQTSSGNFEVALATALVSLLRYVTEGGLPVAKPTVARFLPDKTFSTSGGYMVGVYLPGVTEVLNFLLHAYLQHHGCLLWCALACIQVQLTFTKCKRSGHGAYPHC